VLLEELTEATVDGKRADHIARCASSRTPPPRTCSRS
jgi:hypothetical protein